MMFLTKEAVRLAVPGVAVGTACDGCPPLPELMDRYERAAAASPGLGPICVNSKKTTRHADRRRRGGAGPGRCGSGSRSAPRRSALAPARGTLHTLVPVSDSAPGTTPYEPSAQRATVDRGRCPARRPRRVRPVQRHWLRRARAGARPALDAGRGRPWAVAGEAAAPAPGATHSTGLRRAAPLLHMASRAHDDARPAPRPARRARCRSPARCPDVTRPSVRRGSLPSPRPRRWLTVNPWTPSCRASTSPDPASTTVPGGRRAGGEKPRVPRMKQMSGCRGLSATRSLHAPRPPPAPPAWVCRPAGTSRAATGRRSAPPARTTGPCPRRQRAGARAGGTRDRAARSDRCRPRRSPAPAPGPAAPRT